MRANFQKKNRRLNSCRQPRAKLLDQNLNLSQQNRHQPSVGSRSDRRIRSKRPTLSPMEHALCWQVLEILVVQQSFCSFPNH